MNLKSNSIFKMESNQSNQLTKQLTTLLNSTTATPVSRPTKHEDIIPEFLIHSTCCCGCCSGGGGEGEEEKEFLATEKLRSLVPPFVIVKLQFAVKE